MAKVTLVIEDKPANEKGDVRVTCTPTFAELASRLERGHDITNAEAFAFVAINAIRAKSKENAKGKSGIIQIPKLKGIM